VALLSDLDGVVINFDLDGAFRLWTSPVGCKTGLLAES
jgi:hypothetical protein